MRVIAAALVYFLIAFGAGFALAIPRTLLLEPRIGAFGAVTVELPFVIAASWFGAGFAMRRFAPDAGAGDAALVGAIWLVLLLSAEVAVGLWAGGQAPFAAFFTPAGVLGLAAQLMGAAFPLVRR